MESQKRSLKLLVFNEGSLLGAQQVLHPCLTLEEFKASQSFTVSDDLDHTFFYLSDNILRVHWSNRQGPIQLCGSGAMALRYYYQNIESCHMETGIASLYLTNRGVLLPNQSLEVYRELPEGKLWHYGGMFFLEHALVKDFSLDRVLALCHREKLPVHGFGVFHWNGCGHVRYFVPWYGRDEDTATGSIQRLLTPLVAQQTGQQQQKWIQHSPRGGVLHTEYSKEGTLLVQKTS